MAALFTGTLFLSAALLFLVQPMVGRMVLPMFGGSPAVWNTCMLFFQAALLVGYVYAHLVATRLPARGQVPVHLGLLLLLVSLLPIAVSPDWAPRGGSEPVFRLLGGLLVGCLAVLPVTASAPLLQRWFAGAANARDPYFLYAASNAGSMGGLLAYPLLVEPNLALREQSNLWSVGYAVLIGLTYACGWLFWRQSRRPAAAEQHKKQSQ